MARGWESKGVESQQADLEASRKPGRQMTPEERDVHQQRVTLELALAQTQAELIVACRAAHRDMLQQRLAAIEDALKKLA